MTGSSSEFGILAIPVGFMFILAFVAALFLTLP
jgi:hypothetical protein